MPNPIVDFPWTYAHVAATTVPAVKVGPGVLHAINFNGMTVVGVCTVYDGIDNAGTVIGAITLDSAIHVSCQPIPLIYDCEFTVGLHLEFTAGLVADFTVTYH